MIAQNVSGSNLWSSYQTRDDNFEYIKSKFPKKLMYYLLILYMKHIMTGKINQKLLFYNKKWWIYIY